MTTQSQNTNRNVRPFRPNPIYVVGMTAIGIVMMGSVASAQVTLFDDLGNPVNGSGPVNSPGPVAISFSTGTTPVSLTDVKFVLSGTPSSGGITAELLSNTPGIGSVLTTIGTLSDNSLPATPSVVDFPLASPFALNADTRYWVELAIDGSTTAQLSYTFTNSGVGVPNEFYYAQGQVFPNSTGPDLAQVTGVPEPGAYALFASLGLTGAAFLRRRKLAR